MAKPGRSILNSSAAFMLAVSWIGAGDLAASAKPNIVVILADDLGYADVGFTGCKDIRTPHLDKLAASGVIFTKGYVNHPFCAPSRAALLAGRYQERFGFENNVAYDPANNSMGIDPAETLFPQRLQKAGYITGGIGKWHLGAAPPFLPNKRGFDYFFGFLGGGHDYFSIDLSKPVAEGYNQGLIRNNQPATFDGYLTTELSRDAVRFVEQNHDKPFFLYLAYNAPHGPMQAPDEDIARYADIPDKRRRIYAAMVDVMDCGIGELVSTLEKKGLRENTLIFFLSDNGGALPSTAKPQGGNGSSNAPLRDGKGSLYEGGVRVPFIASWPARIPAGTRYEHPVIALDIGRTAVEHAGGNSQSGKPMEGVDLLPYVLGKKQGPPHDALFWRTSDQRWAILAADGAKAVQNSPGKEAEFYHLTDDISEKTDLRSSQPEKYEALRKGWENWNQKNIPHRFPGYRDYHVERNKFFRNSKEGNK
jgi:arylsulfatase A-like enzyme